INFLLVSLCQRRRIGPYIHSKNRPYKKMSLLCLIKIPAYRINIGKYSGSIKNGSTKLLPPASQVIFKFRILHKPFPPERKIPCAVIGETVSPSTIQIIAAV